VKGFPNPKMRGNHGARGLLCTPRSVSSSSEFVVRWPSTLVGSAEVAGRARGGRECACASGVRSDWSRSRRSAPPLRLPAPGDGAVVGGRARVGELGRRGRGHLLSTATKESRGKSAASADTFQFMMRPRDEVATPARRLTFGLLCFAGLGGRGVGAARGRGGEASRGFHEIIEPRHPAPSIFPLLKRHLGIFRAPGAEETESTNGSSEGRRASLVVEARFCAPGRHGYWRPEGFNPAAARSCGGGAGGPGGGWLACLSARRTRRWRRRRWDEGRQHPPRRIKSPTAGWMWRGDMD
jgi:hypothetical protein